MIDRIISEYLSGKGKRMIVPGFGAFIKRDSGDVVFMDILTSDDGLLAEEVSRNDVIPPEEASAVVRSYGATLKEKLHTEGRVTVQGVGTIITSTNGKHSLVAEESTLDSRVSEKSGVSAEQESAATAPVKTATNARARFEAAMTSGNESPDAGDTKQTGKRATEHSESKKETPVGTHKGTPDKAERTTDVQPKPAQRHGATGANRHTDTQATPLDSIVNNEASIVTEEVLANSNSASADNGNYRVDYSSRIHIQQRRKRKRVDGILIIAIIAIVLAIAALGYGYIVERGYGNGLESIMPEGTVLVE